MEHYTPLGEDAEGVTKSGFCGLLLKVLTTFFLSFSVLFTLTELPYYFLGDDYMTDLTYDEAVCGGENRPRACNGLMSQINLVRYVADPSLAATFFSQSTDGSGSGSGECVRSTRAASAGPPRFSATSIMA